MGLRDLQNVPIDEDGGFIYTGLSCISHVIVNDRGWGANRFRDLQNVPIDEDCGCISDVIALKDRGWGANPVFYFEILAAI
ncbi:hypothetical protein CEXT_709731 [Caerostris extrusa]|uniref:Uncharacterized protein n=1 Tax=Caerostris extrusa TaxID=172846 RepID=A0AAV4SWB1_CAEEX|nr:hypothetical protein CEXT_709731 [Caerostris extrusa]